MLSADAIKQRLLHYGYIAAHEALTGAPIAELPAKLLRLAELYGARKLMQTIVLRDGSLDAEIGAELERPRCGCSDRIPRKRAGDDDRPLVKRIGYWHGPNFRLKGLTIHATREIVDAAFATIQAVVSLPVDRVTTHEAALVVLRTGRCDGPGPELAAADLLPLWETEQREIVFEGTQTFALGVNSEAPALSTVIHEAWHTLGIGHLPAPSLMAPVTVPNVVGPQLTDVSALFEMYPQFAS